jgi:23S rRNA pseudouridine1911/1915/1917 synthase
MEAADQKKTLLDWCVELQPDSPRKRLKAWIAAGRFCLDGQVVTRAGLMVENGQGRITFGPPNQAPSTAWGHRKRIHPKLVLVHLDADLAIVDKEAGLLSVPTQDQEKTSAIELLARYLNDARGEATRRRFFGKADAVQPLPVHRLDQYTSGLLCVAMNPTARAHLIAQLRAHTFLREYVAYVDGCADTHKGTWRHFLRLDAHKMQQQVVSESTQGAELATTHYKVEQVFQAHNVSRLRIRLETGLKHQIRIQAAAQGMALLGDRRYHPGTIKSLKKKGGKAPYGQQRQALHAASIGVQHPTQGDTRLFHSNVPGDLQQLEQRLSAARHA